MGRPPCCSESSALKKGPWTPEEDKVLTSYIQKHGHDSWPALPKRAGLNRCGKSCRLRWINYLRPDVKRGKFTEEEDNLIISLHSTLGNKWSRIASQLPGRTDNEIKNYWNTHMRKRFLKDGIDPQTHRPIPSLSLFLNAIPQFNASSSNFPFRVPNLLSPLISINFQLLHNILQIINMTPLPNTNKLSTSLNTQCDFKKPDELLSDEMINPYLVNPFEDWVKYVNNVALEPNSGCNSSGVNVIGSYGDGFQHYETFTYGKNSSDNICIENQLCGLLSMSPEETKNSEVNNDNLLQSNAFQSGLDDYYDIFMKI